MFKHTPVMLNEVINGLSIKADGIYTDGTAGGGNHSYAIGMKLSPQGTLICVDRDIDAIGECKEKLKPLLCKVDFIHQTFKNIPKILKERGIQLDGLLLDLGVSSHQLETAERGFSYTSDAALDMRMNSDDTITAKDVINRYTKDNLEKIFFEYGEERYSRNIADNIVKQRAIKPIETTLELVDIIKKSMPARALREKQHPAKRIFQAIRIAVNDELSQISGIFDEIIPCMNLGGRIVVITFHSLEDKIVKSAFNRFEHPCTCPPDFPVCVCGKRPSGFAVGKVIIPTDSEIEENPRSRSAKMRIFEKA